MDTQSNTIIKTIFMELIKSACHSNTNSALPNLHTLKIIIKKDIVNSKKDITDVMT